MIWELPRLLQPIREVPVGVGGVLIYLFAGLGGLGGIMSVLKWWTDRRHDDRTADTEDRRVGVVEFQAAMDGMNQVIGQLRVEIEACEVDKRLLRQEVAALRREVGELKGGSR
jgi:hypothetical protein